MRTHAPAFPAVTDATFAAEVLASPGTVLVAVWAEWCSSCHLLAPVLEEVAAERDDLRVVALNADENPTTAASLRVLGLPTMKVFRGGEEIGALVGSRTARALHEQLDRIIGV